MKQNNQGKELRSKKQYRLELIRTILSSILLLTVLIGFLQWRATIKNEAANRFLDIIDKLGNSECDSVRSGAVITMHAHLNENFKEYCNQSIPVLVSHLRIERARPLRKRIVSILTQKKVDPNVVIEPLISEIRDLTHKSGEKTPPDLLKYFDTGEQVNENLLDMSRVLVYFLEREPHKRSDLSGCFLMDWAPKRTNWEQANFEEAHLLRVSLQQADLRDANLQRSEFYDADFSGAFLQKADLTGASLRKVNFRDAELGEATLEWADLVSNDLQQANLTGAKLAHAILIGADMSGAILRNADLFSANLTEADLTDANLTDAVLKNAFLTKATLNGTGIMKADLTDADLRNASLKNAVLTKAIFESAVLEEAMLDYANLENANLASANLADANLVGAILKGVDLKGANLKDANLEDADLEHADLRSVMLFCIDCQKQQNDLEKDTMSEELYKEFRNNGIELSQNIDFSVDEKGHRWLISDNDYELRYIIRKVENKLNIFRETKFNFDGIKKAKNWNKAIFDDYIWDKLSGRKV